MNVSAQNVHESQNQSSNDLNKWFALGSLLIALLVPIAVAVSRIFYPFDLGHFESVAWEPARLIVSGQNPYEPDLTVRPPYVMSVYGPLYYAIIGLGIKLFGFQFWFGRSVSLLAFLVACFCIYRLVARLTKKSPFQNELCCLGVAMFASPMPVGFWSGMHRADFLALAFGLCGLVLSNAGSDGPAPNHRRLVFAGVCFAAAVFCRQTAILPLAFASAWHWKYHRRAALGLLGTCGLIVGAVGAWLQFSSHGGYIWLQWILPSGSPRSLDSALGYLIIQFIAPVAAMVILLALIAGRDKSSASESQHCVRWWQTYFLTASVLAFVTSSRYGANVNYWLEPCAIGAVLATLAVAHRGFGVRVHQVALGMVLFSSCVLGYLLAREEQTRWRDLSYLREIVVALQKYVPPDQPVASLFIDLVLAAGRTPWFNDAYQYDTSPRHRRIFEDAITSRRLGALLEIKPTPPGYRRIKIGNPKILRSVYLDVREDLYQRQQP